MPARPCGRQCIGSGVAVLQTQMLEDNLADELFVRLAGNPFRNVPEERVSRVRVGVPLAGPRYGLAAQYIASVSLANTSGACSAPGDLPDSRDAEAEVLRDTSSVLHYLL